MDSYDESQQRLQLAFEAQRIGQDYRQQLRRRALGFLALGLCGVVVIWLVWVLAVSKGGSPAEPNPLFELQRMGGKP